MKWRQNLISFGFIAVVLLFVAFGCFVCNKALSME